jgi:SAM-dependent methyltransferase
MKSDLLDHIYCPDCSGALTYDPNEGYFVCSACSQTVAARNGIPLFTPPPEGIVPSGKLVRGPDVGTPWRRANWRFLSEQLGNLDQGSTILDVGAGRGDFAGAFQGHHVLAVDVYPYPEVDVVCDLTQTNPFRPAHFDVVALMNVAEHVYDTGALLNAISEMLRPGGSLIVAIPFLVKIHQEPIDYVRYTHYALERLGGEHGLRTEMLEGYYDPVFFLEEGIGNLRNAVLPTVQGSRRYIARALISSIQSMANSLKNVIGEGTSRPPADVKSKSPTGYHVVYRKT